jgi:hypothetical protein
MRIPFVKTKPKQDAISLPPTRPGGIGDSLKTFPRPAHPANVRKMLAPFKDKLASKAELQQLAELQATWERLQSERHQHGHGSARLVILKASELVRKDPTVENIAKLKTLNVSAQDLQLQHRHIQTVLHDAMRDFIQKQVWPRIVPIFMRAASLLEQQAATHETSERDFAELAGLPYHPSQTLFAVQHAAWDLRHQVERDGGTLVASVSPQALLAQILDLPSKWKAPKYIGGGQINMEAGFTEEQAAQMRRDARSNPPAPVQGRPRQHSETERPHKTIVPAGRLPAGAVATATAVDTAAIRPAAGPATVASECADEAAPLSREEARECGL